MKLYINNQKGLSIIEIMVSLLIGSMIISAISSFLIFNIKSFNSTQKQVDIQYDAGLSINQLVNRLMASKGITKIQDDSSKDIINSGDKSTTYNISLLEFLVGSDTIIIKKNGDRLLYKEGSNEEVIADNVNSLKIKSGDSQIFANCKSIVITLELKQDDKIMVIENQVKMRNKE